MKLWIKKQMKYLQGQIFLHTWRLNVCYYSKEPMEKGKNKEKNEAIASITTDHKYMEATVHIHPMFGRFWNDKNRDYQLLMSALVHEFVHVHTDRMYKFAYEMVPNMLTDHLEEIRENETQCIAVAIMNLIPEKQYKK